MDSAIQVHRQLGPGLLESAYQACLKYELEKRKRVVKTEVVLPLEYGDLNLSVGYRIDMMVDDCVIVENKAVEEILKIHEAQLLTYLKLSRCRLGFVLNWHVPFMRIGIRRMVLNL